MALIVPSHRSLGVTFGWTASPGSDVAGYRIYYGQTSGIYTDIVDVGNVTTASVTTLSPGVTYYFSIVAYNSSFVLSDFSNEISYTVPSGSTSSVSPSGSGSAGGTLTTPPLSSSGYLNGQTLGTLHSDFDGFAGMQIFVGPTPLVVSALGRLAAPGNTGTHLVKLVDASDGSDVPGGAVLISMSGAIVGQFRYADLSSPVILPAGAAFYLVSQETSGGDSWYYDDTTVMTGSAATVLSGVWGYGAGQWNLQGGFGQSFGPVDFKYSTTPVGIDHYITSSVLGSQRFSFSGFAGMQISVGGSPITVTALGRMTAVGNSGTHLLKLVNASDGSDVPGGSVTVSMSGATAGQFQYCSLANPVVLSAGQTYYLVSQETSGGDAWFYDDTIVKSTSVAVETCAIWGDGQGQWHLDGSSGQSFGPVDFNYTTNAPTNAPPKPQRYVIGQTVGTPRNGFTGFAGMQIVVGDNPLTVSALGRMVLDGNSGTHIVKLVNASDGSDVPGGTVSISMSGATVGQFQYVDLSSSVVLSAGGTYYLVSQETSGGDSWYYDDTVVDTTSVATQTAAAWASDSGQWHLDGTANHCFGPLDFKCIPIGGVALVQ